MSEQDPLSTYSLWAKQASILEDLDEGDSTTTIKPNGVYIANEKENKKEDMDERRQKYGSNGRGDSGNGGGGGVKPRRALSRRRLVPSSEEDPIMYADEGTQTALGPTPPHSQYRGKDDEYASTTRKLAEAPSTPEGHVDVIKAAKSKRDLKPPPALKPEVKAAQEEAKKSWSRRALARTKDILSITAKEPSTFAFEDYRNKEFKRAGVKAGDNAAAKLHVSSQKLPPEAPKVQSREPPPLLRNATDVNTNANKSVGRFIASGVRTSSGTNWGKRTGDGSAHSLVSSGSQGSSVRLGSGRVSFHGSASGSGSVGGSEIGGPAIDPPRLLHSSQTDGSSTRVGTATSAARGIAATKVLSGKQKEAAIDDRW